MNNLWWTVPGKDAQGHTHTHTHTHTQTHRHACAQAHPFAHNSLWPSTHFFFNINSFILNKFEEIPLVQGKEQWLHFAEAAVKRYPTPKVRETQVRR